MTDLYKMPHATYQEVGLYSQLTQRFISSFSEDVYFKRTVIALNKLENPVKAVISHLKDKLDSSRVTMPQGASTVMIEAKFESTPALIWLDIQEHSEAVKLKIDVFSSQNAVDVLSASVASVFESSRLPLIKWWFQGRHGEETKDFYLSDKAPIIKNEYYPDWTDPEQYLKEYMASDEAILLVAGPPGTGKTTLLRHLIIKYKLCAHVIYDEKIMDKDAPFQSFLFGEPEYGPADDRATSINQQDNIMIIEDADTILGARERDGNKLMSRFLNISDGLIKLPNKKLIFTTNITDFGNVDSALLRPGRCFGVMHTRELNLAEAQAAAKAGGLPIPFEKREYSLAEIFNQGKTQRIRSFGFGVRH
jgi:ATPase family associated with various cellular activities (AAA)